MAKKVTAEELMAEIRKLKNECEQLNALNQALTDELDSIYEGGPDLYDMFEDFLDTEQKGTLH